MLPNKLYRYTGVTWMEIPKSRTSSYLGDREYILLLQEQVNSGKVSLDQLTLDEQEELNKLIIKE